HAYLDQALSRAQCVEIESHLANCSHCSAARDEIAALRDRTTSLLASLGPSRVALPAWSDLAVQAEQRRLIRRRRWESGAWAASLLLAVGLGYGASQMRLTGSASAAASLAARTPVVSPVDGSPAGTLPVPAATVAQLTPPATRTTLPKLGGGTLAAWFAEAAHTTGAPVAPSGVEVSALKPSGSQGASEGLWHTVPLDSTQEGSGAARVEGLQVVQVQVHQVGTDGQITAVEQRLVTGEVIRTVEGPASLLADLMAHQIAGGDSTGGSLQNGSGNGRLADATLTRRVGSRVVLLSGPPEMLSTLMTRLKLAATH
ncbi:MAG: zf-HC2 domain-containing protein, partial [Gemmatimonadota bacterium]